MKRNFLVGLSAIFYIAIIVCSLLLIVDFENKNAADSPDETGTSKKADGDETVTRVVVPSENGAIHDKFLEITSSFGNSEYTTEEYYQILLVSAINEDEINRIKLEYAWYLNERLQSQEALDVLSELDVNALQESKVTQYYSLLAICYRRLGDAEKAEYYDGLMQQFAEEHNLGIGL